MTTCTQSIQAKIDNGQLDTVPELYPETVLPISVTFGTNTLIRFVTDTSQTVRFLTYLLPTQGQANNLTLTILSHTGNTIVNLGTTLITEISQEFQKDVSAGEFFVCIKSNVGNYTGYILGNFSSYQKWAKLSMDAYSGEYMPKTSLEYDKLPVDCFEPIYYEIVDGELPDGLVMNGAGKIKGTPDNLDCMEYNKDISASSNWFGERGQTGEWYPWGRRWNFTVRAYLVNFPHIETFRTFCIRVYNNFDYDRDAFLSATLEEEQPPVKTITVVNERPVLPDVVDDCNPNCEVKFRFSERKEIPKIACEEAICDTGVRVRKWEFTRVDEIKLPDDLQPTPDVNSILEWWVKQNNLLDKETELCCSVKEFLEGLKGSDAFIKYLKTIGVYSAEELSEIEAQKRREEQLKEVAATISVIEANLINGRNASDMDYEFIINILEVNKSLPFDFTGFAGESASV